MGWDEGGVNNTGERIGEKLGRREARSKGGAVQPLYRLAKTFFSNPKTFGTFS